MGRDGEKAANDEVIALTSRKWKEKKMYSDKENINILTSLLLAHGVRHAVVCPGSRNAPITHNLCEASGISCESVTDERSAAFIALGKAQASGEPVVVCVTSGSALVNTLPAVVEAWYQHVPIIVVSADRPEAMIGQLQGQTMPQRRTLEAFWAKEVSLPEPHDDVERWYCNRLANEALCAMRQSGGGPIHINVPISEPLFNFTTHELPVERSVNLVDNHLWQIQLTKEFLSSSRPMMVVGQLQGHVARRVGDAIRHLGENVVVLAEQLATDKMKPCHFDEALIEIGELEAYKPDFIIYIGDTLVSKRAKHFLQHCHPRRCVVVNASGELTDVTMNATDVVACGVDDVVDSLCEEMDNRGVKPSKEALAFRDRWSVALAKCSARCERYEPAYSQMMAAKRLCERTNEQECCMQFANSSAVRLGQLYSTHHIYVNRGVNGIEGSLSTAVGFASEKEVPVYCVIGDLSFFYDQNALWNGVDKKNLRVVMLNNGGGGIFHQLHGLGQSPYRDSFVAAAHTASAKGVCEATGVAYKAARNEEELREGIGWITSQHSVGPLLLEVFTDAETDAREYEKYFEIR